MNGKEVNNRAALIADTATEMLQTDGVRRAAVVVTHGYSFDWPLSIRTPMNDGFGDDTEEFSYLFQSLLKESNLQSKYCKAAGGRTASQQELKLKSSNRSAASYGVDFNSEIKPNFAYDPVSDLTLTIASKGVSEEDTVTLSEEAIKKVNEGYKPKWTKARYFLNVCLGNINRELPKDRTAFSMIALPKYRINRFNYTNKPIIICSQSDGEVVSPANFSIVEAKIKAVVESGKASGPGQEVDLSRISGAIPVLLSDHHDERIIAAGGLVDGADDVKAIVSALKLFSPIMQISSLEQLTR